MSQCKERSLAEAVMEKTKYLSSIVESWRLKRFWSMLLTSPGLESKAWTLQ
jgi:hypothetical protein